MRKVVPLVTGLVLIAGCDPGAPGGPAVDTVTAPPKLLVPGGAERTFDAGRHGHAGGPLRVGERRTPDRHLCGGNGSRQVEQ